MKIAALAMIWATLVSTPLAAQVRPTPGLGDRHIQTVDYRADQVVQIEAAPGYQVTVALSPDEQVQTVALGDTSGWQVANNHGGDHLFIKAIQGGASTNMTVVTNVRQYAFELVAASGPAADTAYIVQFRYPTAGVTTFGVAPPQAIGTYKLAGARALFPSQMRQDGQRTFMTWPKNTDLPAVYGIDSEGRETLLNGMMRNDELVIDAFMPKLVFRLDEQIAYATYRKPKKKRG